MENHGIERSKIVDAIAIAFSFVGKEVEMKYPVYHPDVLPPDCNAQDFKYIAEEIEKFNGSPLDENILYVSTKTSRGYIDLAEKPTKYRINPATTVRIVCNATIKGGEIAKLNPGFAHGVQKELQKENPRIQKYPEGRIIPLSVDGYYFGILMITNKEHNRHAQPQFSVVFDAIVDNKVKDIITLLFDLLKR